MNMSLFDKLSARIPWLFTIQSADEDLLRRGRAFILLCAVLTVSAVISGMVMVIAPPPGTTSLAMLAVIAPGTMNYMLGIVLTRRGLVDVAGVFISASLTIILFLYTIYSNIINDVIWFFSIPIFIAAYAVRPTLLWAVAAFNVGALALVYQLVPHRAAAEDPFAKITTAIILICLLTAISFVQSLITQGLFRETTQAMHHMDRLRQQAEHAQHAAELASQAKSTFLANMSHELRTPLNAIIGYSEILMEDSDNEEARSDLNRIHTAGQHLLTLINDILDLSKIEAGRMVVYPERFNLKEFLDQLVATLRPMAQRNHDALVLTVEGELGMVHTDRTKLRQILLNLLSNAIKFTEQGTVTLRAWRDGSTLVFEIEDTGIGMDEATLGRIFQDFVQADASTTRKYGGTGLGLSLTRKLLGLMDGDISATSEPGHGSRFVVRMPASHKSQPAEVRSLTEDFETSTTTHRDDAPLVLVVDDEQSTRDYIVHQLEREGFAVRACADGAQGLRLARELLPSLIIMDILMPELDGWELLQSMREDERLRDVPVIMASILDERAAGIKAGATDFLSKPIQRDRLVHSIRRALGPDHVTDDPVSVLVVEDTPDSRDLIVRMVEQEPGWRAHTAANGAEALAALETARPHIILLDLMMPEMDGFTFLTRLREHPDWRNVPVLVITAKTLTPDEEERLHKDTRGFLAKTELNRDRLIQHMRRAITNTPRPQ
jgi:signal transduction histidine kinase/CheY-like chemotaxis protein